MTRQERRSRADALIQRTHLAPAPIQDSRDIVFVFERDEEPKVVGPEWQAFALGLLGGQELIATVARLALEPHRHLVVVVLEDGSIALTDIGARKMQRGGDA